MFTHPAMALNLYAKQHMAFRPVYPESLYHWLFPLCSAHRAAWDCATDDGKNALRLAEQFEQVKATDISLQQLDVPKQRRIRFYEAPPESTPFAADTFDLITVPHALHWFHLPMFWNEVNRVLKPGGLFTAWAYYNYTINPDIDQAAEIFAAIIEPFWSTRCQLIREGFQEAGCPWPAIEAPELFIQNYWNIQQFLGFLTSLPAAILCKQALGPQVLNDAIKKIKQAWQDLEQDREVRMPLQILVARKPKQYWVK